MGDFVLTTSSLILCPHGGIASHIPIFASEFRIEGQPVMLQNDTYLFAGCPGSYHGPGLSCHELLWISPSARFFVQNSPALLHTSIPMIKTLSGNVIQTAVVTSFQTSFQEPAELTNVL